MCRWNSKKNMVGLNQAASWAASLTLLLNVHPGTSDQSFGDIFIEHFQRHFYLA
jgi:hypothetical protein